MLMAQGKGLSRKYEKCIQRCKSQRTRSALSRRQTPAAGSENAARICLPVHRFDLPMTPTTTKVWHIQSHF